MRYFTWALLSCIGHETAHGRIRQLEAVSVDSEEKAPLTRTTAMRGPIFIPKIKLRSKLADRLSGVEGCSKLAVPKTYKEFRDLMKKQDSSLECTFTKTFTANHLEKNIAADKKRLAFLLPKDDIQVDDMQPSITGFTLKGLAPNTMVINLDVDLPPFDKHVCTGSKAGWLPHVETWNDITDQSQEKLGAVTVKNGAIKNMEAKIGQTYVLVAPEEMCFVAEKPNIKLTFSVEVSIRGARLPTFGYERYTVTKGTAKGRSNDKGTSCEDIDNIESLPHLSQAVTKASHHCFYTLERIASASITSSYVHVEGARLYIAFSIPKDLLPDPKEVLPKSKNPLSFTNESTGLSLSGFGENCKATECTLSQNPGIQTWDQVSRARLIPHSVATSTEGTLKFRLQDDKGSGYSRSAPSLYIVACPVACLRAGYFEPKLLVTIESTAINLDSKAKSTPFGLEYRGFVNTGGNCYGLTTSEWIPLEEFKSRVRNSWKGCSYTLTRYAGCSIWSSDNWRKLRSSAETASALYFPAAPDEDSVVEAVTINAKERFGDVRDCFVATIWTQTPGSGGEATAPDMATYESDTGWHIDHRFFVYAWHGGVDIRPSENVKFEGWMVIRWPNECAARLNRNNLSAQFKWSLRGGTHQIRRPMDVKLEETTSHITSDCYVSDSEQSFADYTRSVEKRSKTCKYKHTETRQTRAWTSNRYMPFTVQPPHVFVNLPKLEGGVQRTLQSVSLLGVAGSCERATDFEVLSFGAEQPNLDDVTAGKAVPEFKITNVVKQDDLVFEYSPDGEPLFGSWLAFRLPWECSMQYYTEAIQMKISAELPGKAEPRRPLASTFSAAEGLQIVTKSLLCAIDTSKVINTKADFDAFLNTQPQFCLFAWTEQITSTELNVRSNAWHMPNKEEPEKSALIFSLSNGATLQPPANNLPAVAGPTTAATRSLSAFTISFSSPCSDKTATPLAITGKAETIDLDVIHGTNMTTFEATVVDGGAQLTFSSEDGLKEDPDWIYVKAACVAEPRTVTVSHRWLGHGTMEGTNPPVSLKLKEVMKPTSPNAKCEASSIGSSDFADFLRKAKRGCSYTFVRRFGGDLSVQNLYKGNDNSIGIAFELPVKELRSESHLYATRLDKLSIEGLKDSCTLQDAAIRCSARRPSPLNENLTKDAVVITDTFDLSSVTPGGEEGVTIEASVRGDRDVDLSCSSIIVTLDPSCNPKKSVVPIGFTITSDASRAIGLVGVATSILLVLLF